MLIQNNDTISRYSYANSPDIIIEQATRRLWGMSKDEAGLVSTLNLLQARGKFGFNSHASKKVNFAIGEYPTENLTLAASFTSASDSSIRVTTDRLFSGDVLVLRENISSTEEWAVVKITSTAGAPNYTYSCTVISHSTGVFTTSARVELSASAVDYDGPARSFLNIKGDVGHNYMQRSRDTVGKGLLERTELTLAENSLEHVVTLAMKSYLKKIDKQIHQSPVAFQTGSSATDYGYAGGLSYFFNPHDATYSDSSGVRTLAAYDAVNNGYVGVNKVVSGTTIDTSDLRRWMSDLTKYGSKEKFVALSPLMMQLVYDSLENTVGFRADTPAPNIFLPEFAHAFNMPSYETGFGRIYFVVDRSMTGMRQHIIDDGDGSTTANGLYWMVAIDPMHTGMVYLNAEGGGTMTPKIKMVEKERNNSIEEIEIDSAWSLIIDDPRTGGYFGITNS